MLAHWPVRFIVCQSNADQKSRTLLLQFDLSAQFDTIDQKTLISRLDISLGISGYALQVALLVLD